MPEFTESELHRLAQRLEEAEEAGYSFQRVYLCGLHRHRWKIVAWLCKKWARMLDYI